MKNRSASHTQLSHVNRKPPKSLKKKRSFLKAMIALILLLGIVGLSVHISSHNKKTDASKNNNSAVQVTHSSHSTGPTVIAVASPPPNHCVNNISAKLVLISINQRHMWACETGTQVYDAAVVTGMENLPADLTPTGTYKIYAKQTNLYLTGSDSTGSWHDYVYYWMPFLDNQYGAYGFHDATWRADTAFGNISPYSTNASHGCVELPLTSAKWLYSWAPVGTTVTIEG